MQLSQIRLKIATALSIASLASAGLLAVFAQPAIASPKITTHAAVATTALTPSDPSVVAKTQIQQEQYASTLVKGAANALAGLEYQKQHPPVPAPPSPAPLQQAAPVSAGIYSYSQLEALWVSVGGNPAYEATAACIAEHESGGNPRAVSPTDDWGLWQIHGAGSIAFDPVWNAKTAVSMSSNGTNWSPWTTAPLCGV